jgi:hypothetical protein
MSDSGTGTISVPRPETGQLAEIVAGLVRQGVSFTVGPTEQHWIITLTGGF